MQANQEAYGSNLAAILTNLGTIYRDMRRFSDAEAALLEAQTFCRKLVQADPAAYKLDMAIILSNLGALYRDMRRFSDAEAALAEAWKFRKLP